MMIRQSLATFLAVSMLSITPAAAQDQESWLPTLITETPEQGFDLALTMARRAVTTTQTDKEVLFDQRPVYSTDAASLIDVSGVASGWFGTIAAANDYWRPQE